MINSASPVCNCMMFQGSASASAGFIDQYFGGEFESEYPCLSVAAGCGCLGYCCVATGVPHTLPSPSQALLLLWIGASTHTHKTHTHARHTHTTHKTHANHTPHTCTQNPVWQLQGQKALVLVAIDVGGFLDGDQDEV